MFTVTDILHDVQRGILANNMAENKFSYRIVYFVNEQGKSTKYYSDTAYDDLRETLENIIIRENLTTTNCLVVAQTTVRKNGESICLQSRAYSFSLSEYFRKVCDGKTEIINSNYGGRRAQCY